MPELTKRAKARLAAGAVDGAGTFNCIKCKGTKEPNRVNSDRCAACNGVKAVRNVEVTRVKFEPTTEMFMVMQAEAARKNMTVSDYLLDSMTRILRKDAGFQKRD